MVLAAFDRLQLFCFVASRTSLSCFQFGAYFSASSKLRGCVLGVVLLDEHIAPSFQRVGPVRTLLIRVLELRRGAIEIAVLRQGHSKGVVARGDDGSELQSLRVSLLRTPPVAAQIQYIGLETVAIHERAVTEGLECRIGLSRLAALLVGGGGKANVRGIAGRVRKLGEHRAFRDQCHLSSLRSTLVRLSVRQHVETHNREYSCRRHCRDGYQAHWPARATRGERPMRTELYSVTIPSA